MDLYYSFYSNKLATATISRVFLIDVGDQNGDNKTTLTGWNNTDPYLSSVTLVDSTNTPSSVAFNLLRGNNKGVNTQGYQAEAKGFPLSAWRDTMYVDADSADFSITGLDASKKYDLEFYGSRSGTSELRKTQIILNGVTKIYQNTTSDSKGSTDGAIFTDIVPSNNAIAFNLNKNTGGFGYLGIVKISEHN